ISTAAKSTNVGLQQEGINEAASRVNMILTYPWDQNDTNNSCSMPPVLHVSHGDTELDENGSTGRRIGVDKNSSSHTFICDGKKFNASAIKVDGSDDIDDFIGTIGLTTDASGSGGTDYIEKDTVQMTTTVSYLNDNANYTPTSSTRTFNYNPTAGTPTTNIKKIEVTLTSTSTASELNKTIVLKAFSCNIGGFEYESRIIP
uniref:type II secretion system protein n=1 Tax=Sulfurovum sp. TaxID=1969726 RepID=UPI0025E2150C